MKKIALIFALILCLALTVFAFASCGKKTVTPGTTVSSDTSTTGAPTDTEATETQPSHVHTPESQYTVELKPTCTTPGRQSYYCADCGEKIDGTTVEIPIDPNAHSVEVWEETDPVNMFHTTGHRTGKCEYCETSVTEDLTYKPEIAVFTDSDSKYVVDKVSLADARGEKHFYPTEMDPDGNDLYVEFSVLWDSSLLNLDSAAKDCYILGHMDTKPFFYVSPVSGISISDAPFAGAFEYMGNYTTPISDSEVNTPATMCGKADNYADYPNITGADQEHPEWGWHRVGIRIHVELIDGKTGEDLKDYYAVATCFLDGVAIFKLSTGTKGLPNEGSKLFAVESDGNGGWTYRDADENLVRAIEVVHTQTIFETKAYFATDDVSVTCGQGFVMPVEKVTNPTPATYTVEEGVEVNTTIWFQPVSN